MTLFKLEWQRNTHEEMFTSTENDPDMSGWVFHLAFEKQIIIK